MGASKQHQDLIRVMRYWVKENSPCNEFDNYYDLEGCSRPSAIPSNDKTVKKSIPDYYGLSQDAKICYVGEAKTEYHQQSIQDSRADRQIKAFFEYFVRCNQFTGSMFLLAIPLSDISVAKHIVAKAKKETGYCGPVKYFTEKGLEE
tara:strand:+ start:111 stop:551 length:441 start_codon:yes stop_codon:yes gene_type:complete